MVDNPFWEICERVAEVQALLDDHVNGGKHIRPQTWWRRRRPCKGPLMSEVGQHLRKAGACGRSDYRLIADI